MTTDRLHTFGAEASGGTIGNPPRRVDSASLWLQVYPDEYPEDWTVEQAAAHRAWAAGLLARVAFTQEPYLDDEHRLNREMCSLVDVNADMDDQVTIEYLVPAGEGIAWRDQMLAAFSALIDGDAQIDPAVRATWNKQREAS